MSVKQYVPRHAFDFSSVRGIADYNRIHHFDFSAFIRDNRLEKGHVVDLGCGNGIFLQELLSHFSSLQVTGVDKYAYAHHPSVRFVQADMRELPLPSACADLVVSTVALQWVRNDVELAYQEAFRLLKPGSSAFLYPCRLTDAQLHEAIPSLISERRSLPLPSQNIRIDHVLMRRPSSL